MSEKQPVRRVVIDPDYADQRVDNFLRAILKKVPKTRIYRMLRKGEVRVNGKRIGPDYRLQAGDEVRVPPVFQAAQAAPEIPSDSLLTLLSKSILYEDSRLLIINKPSGIPVHGGVRTKVGVIEAMRALYPKLPQLELVHRLDADTSGCLILAKKRSTLRELHALLRAGKMFKAYLALTRGHWPAGEHRVAVALQKNFLAGGERIVRPDVSGEVGKSALTVFRPLQQFAGATLVEAVLHTGRTHQIRVHARYSHHPIACDEKYGDRAFDREIKKTGLDRLFLHAAKLEFILPSTGEKISVMASLDTKLQSVLDCLARESA